MAGAAACWCGERMLRASTAAASRSCGGRVLRRAGAARVCYGERVRQAGAACCKRVLLLRAGVAGAAGEGAAACMLVPRRRADAAAGGCGGERVLRRGYRRDKAELTSKTWKSFWHFTLQLPKHVVFPFLMSACVSKRTRRCATSAQGRGVVARH